MPLKGKYATIMSNETTSLHMLEYSGSLNCRLQKKVWYVEQFREKGKLTKFFDGVKITNDLRLRRLIFDFAQNANCAQNYAETLLIHFYTTESFHCSKRRLNNLNTVVSKYICMCKNSLVGEKGWFVAEWPRLFVHVQRATVETSSTVKVVSAAGNVQLWCLLMESIKGKDNSLKLEFL